MSDLGDSNRMDGASLQAPSDAAILREVSRISGKANHALLAAGREASQLARQCPTSFEAQMLGARLANLHREPTIAIAYLEAAARLQPSDSTVHVNLGVSHFQKDELEIALDHFLTGAGYSKNRDPFPLTMAGRCCHYMGRPREALSHYAGALRWRTDDVGALVGLMRALQECGDGNEANRVAGRLRNIITKDRRQRLHYLRSVHYFEFAGWRRFDDKAVQARAIDAYRGSSMTDRFPWHPETFIMPEDLSALHAAHRAVPGRWISKPARLFGAHGVHVIEQPDQAPSGAGWVVQRYIENPLLVRDRKVVLRLYVMIASAHPLSVYLYREGMVRFAPLPYLPDAIGEPARQLASRRGFEGNAALQKELLAAIESAHPIWPVSRLIRELPNLGLPADRLWPELENLATKFVDVLRFSGLFQEQLARAGRFAYGPKIIGLDVQLDKKLRPWLLEMEKSPGPWAMIAMSKGQILDDLIRIGIGPIADRAQSDSTGAVPFDDRVENAEPESRISTNNNYFQVLPLPVE